MRIQVDARLLRGGGIGRYLREITGPWLADPGMEAVRFLGRPEELEPWLAGADRRGIGQVVPWRDGPYSLLAQLRWPLLRDGAPDATLFPHYDVPLLGHPHPSVVVVHDLTQFRFPQGFPGWKRRAGRVLLNGALNRAGAVITVSEHSRQDLLRLRPDLAPRLHLIPNGVSAVFRPLTPRERTAAEARWEHLLPFVLVIGPAKPHKNLGLAVEVVRRARKERRGLKLVVAGVPEAGLQELRAPAGQAGGWIHGVGFPDDESLRELYALSTAFLFPSRYEGSGLPPREAEACGARVLVSDATALPETMGRRWRDTLRLLSPDDPSAWVEALLGVGARPVTHPGPGPDGVPPAAGRPPLPTWQEASRRTLEVLRGVVEGRAGRP